MPELVSILIPCYNAEPWLAHTLRSALAQTWPHKEIIVINDGSTDGSLDVARSFEKQGVLVLDQANAGQSAAFNTGLAAARGRYIEFLDADDLLAPDKISAQMRRLQGESSDVIASGRWGRFGNDPIQTDFRPDDLWEDLEPVEWLVRAWTNHAMMHGAAYLIPAGLLRAAGGWRDDLSLINDFEFFSRVILHSSRVVFCPDATSYYRSNLPGSLSSRKSPQAWASAFASIELGTTRLLARENSAQTRHACAAVWRNFIFDSYPVVPDLEKKAEAKVNALGEDVGAPKWGPRFSGTSRFVGWKLARRLQLLSLRLRRGVRQ
jgi:glycosyltransferase involved in cell wall biosynthesis